MKRFAAIFVLCLVSLVPWAYAQDLPDFAGLVEKQGPAVVNISTVQTVRENAAIQPFPGVPGDPFFELFRRMVPPQSVPRQYQTQSLGSGFIISPDGYILTNAHVVEGADEVTVKLTGKRELKAKVVGADERTDVALIKINASSLPTVRLGDPNQLRVGEWVVAIGSPFGFENTVTQGIVSAKGRSLSQENYVPFIQTDVAINPGNSGGPLFNLKGEVVGINSQIYSRTGGFMGLSFAIPIDVAMDVANQLKASGKVSRGYLGVVIQEVTKELAESFGLPKIEGALVAGVMEKSPAARGGLEPSDVILKFDGKAVDSASDLPRLIGAAKPGKQVDMEIWRKGGVKKISVQMAEPPADRNGAVKAAGQDKGATRLGLLLRELNPEQRKQLGVPGGLLVEGVRDAAAQAGLRPGDVILAVNNIDVTTVAQFNQVLAQFPKGRNVALLVRRGNAMSYVPIRVDDK
ncbi:MAG: DegQ family serine endoprotease [Sulfuricellaceae bacterium]